MNNSLLCITVLFLLLTISCQKKHMHPVNFYYWKSNVTIGQTEQGYFSQLESRKLYIRFFDVDKENGEIIPKAKIKPFDITLLPADYIPVIFITNRTLANASDETLRNVAQKLNNLVVQIEDSLSLPPSSEIQIDCDWTESTKDTYFHFLTLLKDISKRGITCTIRLHQVKFRNKTGIPPVEKGYLMCYATSDPTEQSDKNSILDIRLLKDYTRNISSYPLALDIALPLYSWGIITNHMGKIKLINGLTDIDLQNSSSFKYIGDNLYEIQEDTFFRGLNLNKGFTVKIESVTAELLQEAKEYMDFQLRKDYSIIYYHLDKPFLDRFTIEELK